MSARPEDPIAVQERLILQEIDRSFEVRLADLLGLSKADHRAGAAGVYAVKDAARDNAEAIERLIQRREVYLWVVDAWCFGEGAPPEGATGGSVAVGRTQDGKPVAMHAVPVLRRRDGVA